MKYLYNTFAHDGSAGSLHTLPTELPNCAEPLLKTCCIYVQSLMKNVGPPLQGSIQNNLLFVLGL